MSQHFFKTTYDDAPVEVLAGWDRPLQGYFAVVMDEDGYALFSNLELPESHPKDFSVFQPYLAKFGISLPEQMVAEILADGGVNMGNKVVHHKMEAGIYSRLQVR